MTSHSDAATILDTLRAAGVTVRAAPDGQLTLSPRSRVPADLVPVIVALKPALLEVLERRGDQPADPPPPHPEYAEAAALAARMAADRDRLRALLTAAGQRRNWPRVQLAPWMWIDAGEEAWQRYLSCPAHGPDEYQRLLDALAT